MLWELFLKMVLKLPWGQKRMFWAIEHGIFHFLQIFDWRSRNCFMGKRDKALKIDRWKRLSWEGFQNMVCYLLEGEKRMFWMFQNNIFHFFCKFLSDKVETHFLGKQGKANKTVGIQNLLSEVNYLEFKSECSEYSKMAFFTIWQVFEWWSWRPFLRNARLNIQNHWNLNLAMGNILEKCFKATLSSKTNFVTVWK